MYKTTSIHPPTSWHRFVRTSILIHSFGLLQSPAVIVLIASQSFEVFNSNHFRTYSQPSGASQRSDRPTPRLLRSGCILVCRTFFLTGANSCPSSSTSTNDQLEDDPGRELRVGHAVGRVRVATHGVRRPRPAGFGLGQARHPAPFSQRVTGVDSRNRSSVLRFVEIHHARQDHVIEVVGRVAGAPPSWPNSGQVPLTVSSAVSNPTAAQSAPSSPRTASTPWLVHRPFDVGFRVLQLQRSWAPCGFSCWDFDSLQSSKGP